MDMQLMGRAYDTLRARLDDAQPSCALVLGSGWSSLTETLSVNRTIDYADIPGLGATGVDGHKGCLHHASTGSLDLLVFQGRRHWYEGAGWEPVALPMYLAKRFGVATVLLTNAAGGIREDLQPGDIMVISDHINAMGGSPLNGPHHALWGPRFPDQTQVYDSELRKHLDGAAGSLQLTLAHGIYAAAAGPAYETPAEVEALRRLGADAVGMSTVPEATLAHAAGMRVLGLSCITNMAAGLARGALSHEDVIRCGREAQPRLRDLVTRFLDRLPTTPAPACDPAGRARKG